jgi:hypothetical protein
MGAMTTPLTTFSYEKDKRTSTYTGHATQDPHIVIETRKVPTGSQVMAESRVKVVSGTEDADGLVLQNKVSFEAVVRYPVDGIVADVTAALAIFRDIVAGDEFANTVSKQEWL